MSTSRAKKRKREEKVQRKLENKRIKLRKNRKVEKLELLQQIKEIKQEQRAEITRKLVSGEYKPIDARSLLPGPNKPCLCGSGKKFKRCCQRDIESGKIKLVAQQDPNLEAPVRVPMESAREVPAQVVEVREVPAQVVQTETVQEVKA